MLTLQPLEHCTTKDVFGGKAANLSRLIGMGFKVPAGWAISTQEGRTHILSAGVQEECNALLSALPHLDAPTLASRAAALRQLICQTEIRPSLGSFLDAQVACASWRWPVAVRSSALAEDSAAASFAGQLDSVLNVSNRAQLEDAIRTVWASAWSERCLRYAHEVGVSAGDTGVVIQHQIDARFAGVLFTRDPLGQRDAAVIEFVQGLGDSLVSGQVSPDRAVVSYPALSAAIETMGGTPAEHPDLEMLIDLVRKGLALEQAFGGPQDIEWCLDSFGQLWLLQSRPAVVAQMAARVTWSNANIAENFPDPVTPFLFSIVSRGYAAYFRNLGLAFGILRRRVDAMQPQLARLVGLHAGRLYYNLSAIHAALQLAPRGTQLAQWFNDFTGATEYPQVPEVAVGRWGRTMEWIRVAACTAWQYLFISSRVTAFEHRVDQYAERTQPEHLGQRSAQELRADLAAFLEIRLHRWNDAAIADAAAMVCYGLLRKKVAALESSAGANLEHDLLKGLPGLASARPVSELWALSCTVRANKVLCDQLKRLETHDVDSFLRDPANAEFRILFQQYLDRWGFRYSRELMLTSPTPQEDPAPMIRILQSYLADTGPGPDAVASAQTQARLATTQHLESVLSPNRWLRRLPFSAAGRFQLLLAATQGAIRFRERARMKQALLYTRLRHVMLAIGSRLTEQHVLTAREDVFFLNVDEVLQLLDGSQADPAVPARVSQRRAAFEGCVKWTPPDSLSLPEGELWEHTAQSAMEETSGAHSTTLRGVSACGGIAEGEARVVEDVCEIGRIRSGDLLVTRQTDPGWAAVFFLVKGLVIERGGMLSHGAIIAREYGIPAVVGVPKATQRIQNGQTIRINANRGVVETSL